MTSDLFSFTFDFNNIQGGCSALLEDCDHKEQEATAKGKQLQDQMFSIEELELDEINGPPELGGLYQERDVLANKGLNFYKDQNQMTQQLQHQQSNFGFPQFQSFHQNPKPKNIRQEPFRPTKENPCPVALSTLELLGNYASGFKKLKGNIFSPPTNDATNNMEEGRQKLSTEEIMRVAGARYIHFSDQGIHDFSIVMHPFGYALSGLSEEETRDVELVHLLLAAAEKVGYQQYERASRLLSCCERMAAERANSAQRVVYYFAEALRRRIDKETGRITAEALADEKSLTYHGLGFNISFLKCYQKIPFNQVMYYAAIQSILENVATASEIHVIDFEIRSGVHWTALMQALSERVEHPIRLLKITAVGLKVQEKDIEKVGNMLSSFAESLSLPFSFSAVCVSCFSDIKKEILEIQKEESLIIYCSMILRIMLAWPGCLENLLGMIKKLNPSIMVVVEIEANHNSPSFVTRFTEALFFYSAFFDALETCLDQDIGTRTMIEETLNKGIHSIVALEGADRTTRSVKIDVWRAFFTRFRMVEIGFSDSCLYQANLLLTKFPCASCCNFERNGNSLIIGWKGTPIHSLSVWKFPQERGRLFLNSK